MSHAKRFGIEIGIESGFMSFDKLVEEKIREAIERGEFDDLPGKGKPLDLSRYFAAPEDQRAGYAILKNAGFIPEEVELLKEIESLKLASKDCADEGDKKRIKKIIDEKLLKLNLIVERYATKRGFGRK